MTKYVYDMDQFPQPVLPNMEIVGLLETGVVVAAVERGSGKSFNAGMLHHLKRVCGLIGPLSVYAG